MEQESAAAISPAEAPSVRARLAGMRQKTLFRIVAAYAVVAWLVIQVAATVAPAFELSPWVVRAVILFAVLGFVATVAYFGFVRPAGGETAGDLKRTNRLASLAFGGALVVAALAGVGYIARQTLFAREQVSLAVLPFADLSPKRDKAYFAEGVAEEILSALAAEKDIKVLGRTSARQIERDPDPRAIRTSLGVTHLLEGSTRTAGDGLRINVRLIDTADGSQLWEEEYQGQLADVFSVQDRIAAAVAKRLRGTLFGGDVRQAKSTGIDAYQTYLAARALMRERSEPALKQALGLAAQVIRADPNYGPGHALYAELVWLLSDHPWAYGSIPVGKAARIGAAHARTAIRLAPEKADGYAALGLVLPPKKSIDPLKRAIALDPSRAEVRIWLALDMYGLGRNDEALLLSREAAAIEPLWPMPLSSVVQSLAASGLQDEALKIVRQYRRNGSSNAQLHRMLFLVADRGSDLSKAVKEARTAYSLDATLPDIRGGLMTDLFAVGLQRRDHEGLPLAASRFATSYYDGNTQELERRIRLSGSKLWQTPDVEFALFYLASIRDWTTLARLFDQRAQVTEEICSSNRAASYPVLMALREVGRLTEADEFLRCVQRRFNVEFSQKARDTKSYAGDLEADRAMLASLKGDREQALQWLGMAVDRGWFGRPFSPNLRDRPAFDKVRDDTRLTALQRRIDAKIARERAEVLAGR